MINLENARNYEEAFIYSIEVQLATLGDLLNYRATPRIRIERQIAICVSMLTFCINVSDSDAVKQQDFPKVYRMIKLFNNSDLGVQEIVNHYALDYYGSRIGDSHK